MGRDSRGVFTKKWKAPDYEVGDDGKVIGGYQPAGPHNWGRWGSDDRRGTANLIGPEQVVAAAHLVRRGAVFSLAMPIDATVPTWPGRPAPRHYFTHTGSDAIVGNPAQALAEHLVLANDDGIDINLQGSTQWDGFGHCQAGDSFYNGYWSGNVTAVGGDPVLGIENQRESFIGRGVLIDVAGHSGVESLEPGTIIGPDTLDEVCAAEGITVTTGDIVLIRTGYPNKWSPQMESAEKRAYFERVPGVGASAVDWFASRDVGAVASDTSSFECFPPERENAPLEVHRAFLVNLGLPIGEMWDLEALALDCAQDHVYQFMLVAPPLYIPRAVGSPLNPIAIK